MTEQKKPADQAKKPSDQQKTETAKKEAPAVKKGPKVLRTVEFAEDSSNVQEVLELIHLVDAASYTVRDIYARIEAIVVPFLQKTVRPGQTVSILEGRVLEVK